MALHNEMTARELLDYLVEQFPDFAKYWEEEGDHLRSGGPWESHHSNYTDCAVFQTFALYFDEYGNRSPSDIIASLFADIEEVVVGPPYVVAHQSALTMSILAALH